MLKRKFDVVTYSFGMLMRWVSSVFSTANAYEPEAPPRGVPTGSNASFQKYRYYKISDEFPQIDSDQESEPDSEAQAAIASAAQDAAIVAAKQAKRNRARNAKDRKTARNLAT